MKELRGLNFDQNKKFRYAIECGYFDTWEQDPRKWKHTFVGAFLWKYPARVKVLNIFKNIVGDTPKWDDLTDDAMRDFLDELSESSLAMSSVRTLCAELKAVLNENRKKVPSTDFAEILSVRAVATKPIYLTTREMEQILAYKPTSETERYVHRIFCIAMMTGARRVDAEKLVISNCNIDTNFLSYVPQKTPGIVVNVPVDEKHNLRSFLADETGEPCCLDTFNSVIRRICYVSGIDTVCSAVRAGRNVTAPKWELVSSHTARRTFATNLYLAGVSLEDIAMMMGHGKNIETTKRYICAERQVSPNVMAYFQPSEMAG